MPDYILQMQSDLFDRIEQFGAMTVISVMVLILAILVVAVMGGWMISAWRADRKRGEARDVMLERSFGLMTDRLSKDGTIIERNSLAMERSATIIDRNTVGLESHTRQIAALTESQTLLLNDLRPVLPEIRGLSAVAGDLKTMGSSLLRAGEAIEARLQRFEDRALSAKVEGTPSITPLPPVTPIVAADPIAPVVPSSVQPPTPEPVV